MTVLLAVVMLLIPLAIAPGSFFYFDVTPKIVVLLLGTAAATLWWAAAGGAAGFYRSSRAARWFLWATGGMAVSLVVSTVASVNPALSFGGSSWRYWGLLTQLATLGFAFLVAVCVAGRPERLRVLLRSVAAGGLLVAAYGIAQYFGWDPWLDARGYHAGEGIFAIVRPPATLGHADYAANWLLFVVFASVALAPLEQRAGWKWLAWTAAAAGSVAIVLSGTRAALAGLAAGALLLALWRGTPHALVRRGLRAAIIALAIMSGAALFYLSPAGARLRARVHWALQEPVGGARVLLWRDSLRMAAARWPAGFGPDTFIGSFARYQSAELSRAFPDFYHESPHNIFVDALVSQGVPGLVCLLAIAASALAAAVGARGNAAAGALGAGLAAMTISQQFTCFTMPTALAYYVICAMLVSICISKPLSSSGRRWARVAVALPCAALMAYFGVRLGIADTALAAVRRDLDAGNLNDATARYAAYQDWRWPGSSADLWYSRRLAQVAASNAPRLVRMEAFQQAGLAAQRAPQTTEAAFNAYYNLAAYYARKNDFISTEQSLRSAISYAPNWFKTHWMLAQVLQAASRLPEAEAEAATAVSLDGGKHPEVTSTLAHIRALRAAAPLKPQH